MLNRLSNLALALIVVTTTAFGAYAQTRQPTLIRDAEIENTIRTYATPLFAAAGLDPTAIQVHLIGDDSLNAFVAGGKHVFLNTGLLLAAESPNQVIGVIAHETGHIAGGHLARTQDALRGATLATIIATVLGAAVIAAGSPTGGLAVIAGGTGAAEQSLLRYSRTQEQAADQFAVTVLERTGQSARGLMEFLETLEDQEVLYVGRQDPYLRTHPIAGDRVEFVRNFVANSPHSDAEEPPEYQEMFRRMQAKLRGFMMPISSTLTYYDTDDASLEARYARAIAYYRRPDLDRALPLVDGLIAERPGDPYFQELKGQILFENGRVQDAVEAYRRAADKLPDTPLILVSLGQALIETNDPKVLEEAIGHLERAARVDPDNARVWRMLSIAYGRDEQLAMSALASAEFALLTGHYRDAVTFAQRADKALPYGSPGQLRAQDIEQAAKNAIDKRQE